MTSARSAGVPWCVRAIFCRGEVNLWSTLVPNLGNGFVLGSVRRLIHRKVPIIACAPVRWIRFIGGIAFSPQACIRTFEAESTTGTTVAPNNCLAAEGDIICSRLSAMAARRLFVAACALLGVTVSPLIVNGVVLVRFAHLVKCTRIILSPSKVALVHLSQSITLLIMA